MGVQEELEAAIGHGPALPEPAARVAAGRTALRRRRALVAVGGAVAVAAVVVPVAVVTGGADRGTDLAPAAPPTSSAPSATAGPSAAPPGRSSESPGRSWPRGEPPARVVLVDGSWRVVVRDGAVVHERRTDLFPRKPTESAALDLTFRGRRHWIALEWDDDGSMGVFSGPWDTMYGSFGDFVAKTVHQGGMQPGNGPASKDSGHGDEPVPGTVTGLRVEGARFVSDGTATVLEQRPSPDLPANFAPPGTATAAAYVEQDGTRYLVLYRQQDGAPELITVEAAGHGRTLDGLLDWARTRYEDGVGLL
jgi:hypothetical protein